MNFSKKLVLSVLFTCAGIGLGVSYIFASNYFNEDFFLIILLGITVGSSCGLISILLYKILLKNTINIMINKYSDATQTIIKKDKDFINLGFDKICELYIHSLSEICDKYTQYAKLMKNLLLEISKAKDNIDIFKEKIENIKSHEGFFELVLSNFAGKVKELESKTANFNNNIVGLNKFISKKESIKKGFNKLESIFNKIYEIEGKETVSNFFNKSDEFIERYNKISINKEKLENLCLKLYEEIEVEAILEQIPEILDNLKDILSEIKSETKNLESMAEDYKEINKEKREKLQIQDELTKDEYINNIKESEKELSALIEEIDKLEDYDINSLLNIFKTSIKDIETILADIRKLSSDLKESENLVKIIEEVKININYILTKGR